MSVILAAILLIGGLLAAVAAAVGTLFVFSMAVYDLMSRESTPAEATHDPLRIAAERGVARGFVLGGGLFWSIASFAGLYSFTETGAGWALLGAFYPLIACLATLVVGWYFERVVAVMLVLASFAVVAWGVIYQFELGVWLLMTFTLIGPMLTAAALFWLARRDQDAFELATSFSPELAFVFSARSTIV